MRNMLFLAVERIKNEKNRKVLKMRLENELEVREISEILGCSEKAVRIRIFRAYEELKQLLGDDQQQLTIYHNRERDTMLSRTSEYEVEGYTPEELRMSMELDRLVAQVNGKVAESGLVLDIETARWLSEARRILTEIKESYKRRGEADNIQNESAPQPASNRKKVSDLILHGEEMLKPFGYILKVRIEDKTEERQLTEGEYLLGSSPQAEIRLADTNGYISRQHAKLIIRRRELFILDLNSTNGTFINERRIPPDTEVKINPSDKVSLADTMVEFEVMVK